MPSAHTVLLGVWVGSGGQGGPDGLGGVSHVLEQMVFKGTSGHTSFEIAQKFDGMGAAVDAFTTKDAVAFTVKVLPEFFEETAKLLAEMLLQPAFDAKLVTLEQGVVIEEIQEALDTPDDRLHDAFCSRLYGKHRRGRPILGTPGAVRSFHPELLIKNHQRLFSGPNMVISLAGNVHDRFRELVAESFDVPASPGALDKQFSNPVKTIKAATIDLPLDELDPFHLELNSPIIQTYFEIGNLGVALGHPDRLPVFLLTNILGGGMSSRIFQAVREREGLAYTVYNYSDMGRDTGFVSCAGSCSPEKLERLVDVISVEYDRLIAEGVRTEEIDSNRAQIKSHLIFSLEGVTNQMFRAARNEIYYGRFVPVVELVDRVDSVTKDDLARCSKLYFAPDSLLVAIHGPGDA
ncbi:MAG: insulinase family protein [bacterium]|nr:insulinase family protein [bacterium]